MINTIYVTGNSSPCLLAKTCGDNRKILKNIRIDRYLYEE
jgi:hypothetical protein